MPEAVRDVRALRTHVWQDRCLAAVLRSHGAMGALQRLVPEVGPEGGQAMSEKQLGLFGDSNRTSCLRCGRACRIAPIANSQARMLKRGDTPKGLCVNCAVHDQLRHLYPANLILARSGPQALLLPHIQQQFFNICKLAGTDAAFDEIDWGAIGANWDLPFPTKLKRTATNPVSEEELAGSRLEGEQRRAGTYKEPLTEEDYQAQRQVAISNFLDVVRKEKPDEGA